jgi:hypothetical protein
MLRTVLTLNNFVVVALFALFIPKQTCAQDVETVYAEFEASNGVIRYAVHLPVNFDPAISYPVLVGPGDGISGADKGFYWNSERRSTDWIIVDAPLWKTETAVNIEALLDHLLRDYSVEGRKFHLACWSANSAGIFDIAISRPDRFHSITAMAGNPSRLRDSDVMDLRKMKVQFIVGEKDTYWKNAAIGSHKILVDGGVLATIEIIPDGEHVMRDLVGPAFMQILNNVRD